MSKKQNFIGGAAVLTVAVVLVKLISACYKIPLGNLLGDEGMGHFSAAYNIYSLLLTLSTAGLPLAISKLVAESRSQGRLNQSRRYFRVGLRLFVLLGILGTAIMFFLADPLAMALHDSLAAPSIRVLAVSVLCVCVMSAIRGYTQGQNNMYPSAWSQVIEAIGKLVIGLLAAGAVLDRGFGVELGAAGAIFGVAVGTVLSLIYLLLWLLRHRRDDPPSGDRPESDGALLRRILAVGIPITLGATGMSLLNLLDQAVILGRLQDALGFAEKEAVALYGQYTFGHNLFNLPSSFIPPITMSLIPSVSAAIVRQDHRQVNRIISASLRLIALFALPAGVGLSVLAGPILLLLYPAQPEAAAAAAYHLQLLGIASIFVCLMLLTNSILQAHGREQVPIVTMIVGGAVKVALNWFLVADPNIGIKAAPISTLVCYGLISVLNLAAVSRAVAEKPRYVSLFAKPLVCSVIMGFAADAAYGLLSDLGNVPAVLSAILFAVAVYALLVLALRVITRDDLLMLPKGEKIANLLRLKENS